MQLFKCTTVSLVHVTETHWINAEHVCDAVGAIENRTAIKENEVGRRLSSHVQPASPIEMNTDDIAYEIEDFEQATIVMTPFNDS